MNKKGDIPMILLFLVAITLSLSALFVFISFKNENLSVSNNYNSALEEINKNYNRIPFENEAIAKEVINCKDCGGSYQENYRKKAAEREKEALSLDGIGNFFGKIRSDEFVFEKKDDGYILEVKGVFVEGNDGKYSKITRNFDISMEFDLEGNLKLR